MSAGRTAPFAAVVVACLLAACSPDPADLARQRALDELDDQVEEMALEDVELINKAETAAAAEQGLRARQGVIGVALDGSTVTWARVLTARGDGSSWPARYDTTFLRACVEISADVSSVPSRRLDWAGAACPRHADDHHEGRYDETAILEGGSAELEGSPAFPAV